MYIFKISIFKSGVDMMSVGGYLWMIFFPK